MVIPNPVIGRDHARRCAREVDHAWLRPGSPPLVLGVGRLAPQKGFATLIQAFALVRERRGANLLILGEGPERPALAERAAALGLDPALCLPGLVADPLPFMARAGVYVLSSAWEGMPGTLVEAMGCGCPVVSTDCPGGSSELLRGGALGPLVPVGDHRAMADAIGRVLDAPVDRDLLRAAVRRHGVERAGEAYVSALAWALGGPRRAEPVDDGEGLGG